jgi:NifU-like domain
MPEEKESIEWLIGEVERLADPALKATVKKLVQALMELHAAGIERIVEIASGSDGMMERFAHDERVKGLLLLHGLHPVSFEDRIRSALEKVQPYLRSHGGGVDLVGVEGGVIRLRTSGCHGCVKSEIENAIYDAAPDLSGLVIEEQALPSGFIPLVELNGR